MESYLNRVTLEPLKRECYVQLLKEHQKDLLSKKTGVEQMLATNASADLARLYSLYSKYPQDLDPIADMVHEHIKKVPHHHQHYHPGHVRPPWHRAHHR